MLSLTLYELHRIYAALVNKHMHHDLRGIQEGPELEAFKSEILDMIEAAIELKEEDRLAPWSEALKRLESR